MMRRQPAAATAATAPRLAAVPVRHLGVLSLLAVGACAAELDRGACNAATVELDGGASSCQAPVPKIRAPRGSGQVLLQSEANVALKLRTWGQSEVALTPHDDDAFALRQDPEPAATRTPITCRSRVLASQIEPGTACPPSCPFWAEEVGSHLCQFQCVTSSECGTIDPNATVADLHGMYCRACIVPGCEQCNTFGGADICYRCREGYRFWHGQCLSPYRFGWYTLYAVLVLILVYLVAWYLDLRSKEITNEAGLEQGIRFRKRTRLHKPKEGDDTRQLWPLTTNLLTEQAAGPGLALFFNFQLAVLYWASAIFVGWMALSFIVSTDLLALGTKDAATPQQLCTVTTWGFKTQHRLMWAKVGFMTVAYVVTFAASVGHAIVQLRRFESMDDEATMKDYAAMAYKLPRSSGSSREAERDLKTSLERATGEEIVGVSICWNFADKAEDEIMHFVEQDTEQQQRSRPSFSMHPLPFNAGLEEASGSGGREDTGKGCCSTCVGSVRASFDAVNASLGFSQTHYGRASVTAPPRASLDDSYTEDLLKLRVRRRATSTRQQEVLESLVSTGKAFVVFPTEEARDKAVEMCRQTKGLKLSDDSSDSDDEGGGALCQLQEVTFEPETVKWGHFSLKTKECVMRLMLGIVFIALALCLWTLCFYLPYAMYVTSFSYARGEQPTVLSTGFFSLLVVAGNQTMYFVCRAVSEAARFRCKDTTEMTYMTLYFLACLVNFAMDMAVTSYTTYVMMVGMNARTSGGLPLENLTILQIFESYPMQRALGHFFFWYAFPACFLAPFLAEPLFAIYLPGHIFELLVRSHPNVRGMEAERHLAYFSPMDLSRYADLLLNVTIAVVAFLFPGSYVWKMFLALFGSHVYIIFLDHFRVLRATPACHFSTNATERCVQALAAIPVGLLSAFIVLKWYSVEGVKRPANDRQILWGMVVGFVSHVALHWLLLFWLVPKCGRHHEHTPVTYAEVSRKTPCSWFSANPAHCLRSRYIHRDNPPCDFYYLGKEHLLKSNPSIGIYFEDEAADTSPRHSMDVMRGTTAKFTNWLGLDAKGGRRFSSESMSSKPTITVTAPPDEPDRDAEPDKAGRSDKPTE